MNQSNQMKEVQPNQSKFRQIIGNIAFGITLIVCLFVVLFCSMGNNRKMETASADTLYQDYNVSEGFAPAYSVVGYDLTITSYNFFYVARFSGFPSSSTFFAIFDSEYLFGCDVYLYFRDISNSSHIVQTFLFDFDESYYYLEFFSTYSDFSDYRVDFVISSSSISSLDVNGKLYFMEGEYDSSVGVPLVLQVSDVWGQIAEWFAGCFPDITQFFYVDGSLTFAGTCAVIMAGVALILLIFNLIRSFLPMRG